MSEDTLQDLMQSLPPRLEARAAQLGQLARGELDPEARRALEAEAEHDEDLAYALTLFAPFDLGELAGVEDRVAAALGAQPKLRVVPAEASDEMSAPAPVLQARASGRLVVGGFGALLAIAAVVIGMTVLPPKAAFQVEAGANTVASIDEAVRFELASLDRDAVPGQATVLAVAGEQVRRVQVDLQRDGDRFVVELPAGELSGGLAGSIDLLFLSSTKERGLPEAEEVRSMITAFGDRAAARLFVQPPMYALLIANEDSVRGDGDLKAVVTASTAVEQPGRVTFVVRPKAPSQGALQALGFVVRSSGTPEPLAAPQPAAAGAFRFRIATEDLLVGAQDVRVHLVVGPAGESFDPSDLESGLGAPWRHVSHDLYLSAP